MYDAKKLKEIEESLDPWARKTQEVLDKRPERKDRFETLSGIPVERVYTPLSEPEIDYMEDLGFPGDYPYTRGVQPTMYRGRLWTMRQYAGFASAEESNRRYKYLLEQGQTGLSVAFDLPGQYFHDDQCPRRSSVGYVCADSRWAGS
jgi:methylmalonyl-CoA mutase N-terminal domain/subunit